MDKYEHELEASRASGGDERHHAEKPIRHAPVGSSGRPPLPGQDRSRPPLAGEYADLSTLNATSEAELVNGYGGIRPIPVSIDELLESDHVDPRPRRRRRS